MQSTVYVKWDPTHNNSVIFAGLPESVVYISYPQQ